MQIHAMCGISCQIDYQYNDFKTNPLERIPLPKTSRGQKAPGQYSTARTPGKPPRSNHPA